MPITKSTLRLITFIAAIPFLYFLFTKEPYNWLFYTSVLIMLAASFGINILEWKGGERKKVKSRMVMYGIYAVILIIIFVYQLYRN